MIYCIDLGENEKENLNNIREKYSNTPLIGIALGIPLYTNEISNKTLYKINYVEQRKLRQLEYDFVEDYEEEE